MGLNDVQIVHQRLDKRTHLSLLISRNESDVLIAKYYRRSCEDDLVKVLGLLQCGRQSQQSLPCSSPTGHRNELYGRIQAGVQREFLLIVARTYSVGLLVLYQHDPFPAFVEPRAEGRVSVPYLVKLVGFRLQFADCFPVNGCVRAVGQALDCLCGNAVKVLDLPVGVLDLVLLNPVGQVILNLHSGGLGFHPEIDVFSDEGYEPVRVVVAHPDGRRENPVVGNVIVEHSFHAFRKRMPRVYPDVAQSFTDRNPVFPE